MARPKLNRHSRRAVTAVSRKPKLAVVGAPTPSARKIATIKMEPSSLTITEQGMAFAIGKDGLLYGWNAILGGWVLNVMNEHDKEQLAKQVAERIVQAGGVAGKPVHTKSAEALAASLADRQGSQAADQDVMS